MDGETYREIGNRYDIANTTIARLVRDLPRRAKVIPDDDRAQIIALRQQGFSIVQIVANTGISTHHVLRIIETIPKGKPLPKPKLEPTLKPVDSSTKEEVRRLYISGETIHNIMTLTGCKEGMLYHYVVDLPKRQKHKRSTGSNVGKRIQPRAVTIDPVIELFCRVCPTGLIAMPIVKGVIYVHRVSLTCPDCGQVYCLSQLVSQDVMNAKIARLARVCESVDDPDTEPETLSGLF